MKEKISVLVDQEIPAPECREILDAVIGDELSRETWSRYHLIGCVMRGEIDQVGGNVGDRVSARLEAEPTVLCPHKGAAEENHQGRGEIWKSAGMLAMAASIALVAVITLKPSGIVTPVQVAASSAPPADSEIAAFEQEFGEMLVEHGEFTSSPALNGLVAYAKLVSNQRMDR